MADKLTEQQIKEFKRAFLPYAKFNRGSASADDLVRASTDDLLDIARTVGLYPNENELNEMKKEVDSNGTGMFDFPTFLKMLESRLICPDTTDECLRRAFAVFDKDCTGYITSLKLRKVMADLGEELTDEEINEMIMEADVNGDGLVDYCEFVAMMRKER